jgi:hypothetical protein
MKEPAPIAPTARLYVITETVALTITQHDQPPIQLEVCRLAREPYWLIRAIEPKAMTVVRTDDGDGDAGYAAYDIKIDGRQ